jgi:hypothetical protein
MEHEVIRERRAFKPDKFKAKLSTTNELHVQVSPGM